MSILDDATKICNALLYHTDAAMLWWRRRSKDIRRRTCTIASWDEFKRELRKHFYPEHAEDEVRAKLRRFQ